MKIKRSTTKSKKQRGALRQGRSPDGTRGKATAAKPRARPPGPPDELYGPTVLRSRVTDLRD